MQKHGLAALILFASIMYCQTGLGSHAEATAGVPDARYFKLRKIVLDDSTTTNTVATVMGTSRLRLRKEGEWESPFMVALTYKKFRQAQILYHYIDPIDQEKAARSYLYASVMRGRPLDLEASFLKKLDLNADYGSETMAGEPILFAAIRRGDVAIVETLLCMGAKAEIEYANRTALYSAISSRRSNRRIVEILLKHGADPNKYSMKVLFPLSVAAESGNAEIVKILLDYGADAQRVTNILPSQIAEYKRTGVCGLLKSAGMKE